VFFHSDTVYGQRLLSLKNNGKVHLHLIIQYEKIRTFLDPLRKNIGLSRGTIKGRSLDEFIIRRIISIYTQTEWPIFQTERNHSELRLTQHTQQPAYFRSLFFHVTHRDCLEMTAEFLLKKYV